MKAQRLGSQTGSLINHVMSGSKDAEPQVGMGATMLLWSDRHACTIVEVSPNKKRIGVQQDNAKRTDNNGMSDSQSYAYSPNVNAPVKYYTLRKNGAWVREGESMKGSRIAIGYRAEFHDFSF
jgi:hypothetical protein